MANSILTLVTTPFKQPFAQYPGVFIVLTLLGLAVGFGLGRLPGAYRRRVLEKRLSDAKEQARRSEADSRRFAELLGVSAAGRAALTRLGNDKLREKTHAFVSALQAQLAAWHKEIDAHLLSRPAPLTAATSAEEANEAWSQEAKRMLAESSARLATYRDRYKVDAVMLRVEMSRRLERPPERSMDAVTRVSSPVSLAAMAKVTGDLEALAKLLPDDATAHAQSAERRRRVPRRA